MRIMVFFSMHDQLHDQLHHQGACVVISYAMISLHNL